MSIAGLILMGGKATRMQGKQKAFLNYKNQPFYKHCVKSLTSVNTIYISVAKKEGYSYLGYPLIEDSYLEIGPLGGICTALQCIEEDALFVIPCDMPKVSQTLVDRIIRHYQETKKAVIIQDSHGVHPLVGIYTKEILPLLQQQISNKKYQARAFIAMAEFDILSLDDQLLLEDELININRPQDLEKIQ